jgi:hypothetical protein
VSFSPRLPRFVGATLGCTLGNGNNANGVVAEVMGARERNGRNPECFRGWDVWRTMTQGSSFLATLGFETESRWDSRPARLALQESRTGQTKNQRDWEPVRPFHSPKG